MVNQPDQDTQGVHSPARKLGQPEPPDAGQQRRPYSSPQPGRFIHQSASSAAHGLFTRLFHRIRTDPGFALLSGSVSLAVIIALVLVSLGVSAFASGTGGPTWSASMTQHPVIPTPTGRIDNKPTFPTPASEKGSSTSSQPGSGPTPSLQPTPTAPTTPDNPTGVLTVEIVNLPDVVNNRAQVRVDVQTSEAGVSIRLQVNYDVAPFFLATGATTTNGDGQGALNWNIRVRNLTNGNNAQATVVVIATDQRGQQATSQAMAVTITG